MAVLSACGSTPTTSATVDTLAATSAPAVGAPAPSIALPAVDVVNLTSGQTINLADVTPTGPTLVWFWAPH